MSDALKSLLTTQGNSGHLKDSIHDEHIDDIYTMPISDIVLRPHGNKRPLDLVELISRAESIDAVGLIEPIVVDAETRLIAGLHRYSVFQYVIL